MLLELGKNQSIELQLTETSQNTMNPQKKTSPRALRLAKKGGG
jgi:hypothetical protein